MDAFSHSTKQKIQWTTKILVKLSSCTTGHAVCLLVWDKQKNHSEQNSSHGWKNIQTMKRSLKIKPQGCEEHFRAHDNSGNYWLTDNLFLQSFFFNNLQLSCLRGNFGVSSLKDSPHFSSSSNQVIKGYSFANESQFLFHAIPTGIMRWNNSTACIHVTTPKQAAKMSFNFFF